MTGNETRDFPLFPPQERATTNKRTEHEADDQTHENNP
jgi:hypothetical protein